MLGKFTEDPEAASASFNAPGRYWKALVNGPNVELDKGFRVIQRERMIAAKMAAPALEEFRQFMTTRRPPGWAARPTSEGVIKAVSVDLNQTKRAATRGRKGDGSGT